MTAVGMRVQRGGGTAVWRQIARHLEELVTSGRMKPGDKLPSEYELAQGFGVNRHTVRQAVGWLSEVGLLRVEQGKGMFVREAPLAYALGPRTRFSENIRSSRREPTRELLSLEQVPAPGDVARELGLGADATVWRLDSLNKASGRPIGVASHFFPFERFPELPAAYKAGRSITEALRRLGVEDYRRRWTRVSAAPASNADARLLGLARHRPVLVTESLNVDGTGRPVEFGRARMAADQVTLTINH